MSIALAMRFMPGAIWLIDYYVETLCAQPFALIYEAFLNEVLGDGPAAEGGEADFRPGEE